MKLGLVGNPTKEILARVLPDYIAWLRSKNIEYVLSSEFRDILGSSEYKFYAPSEVGKRAHLLLSFGGDGTLLNSVRILQGRETPVVGVNVGGLGYLTVIGADNLHERTEDLLEDRFAIEKRMVLEAKVADRPDLGTWYALNDVVVNKGGYSRMIELEASVDGEFLNSLRSDGLIIATPTGSTAYNLSAGGPIIEPMLAGILYVPLNPHSLSNRPLLISDERKLGIHARTGSPELIVNVDGRLAGTMFSGETLEVKRAGFTACLAQFSEHHFFQVLRRKLGWGREAEHRE